MSKNFRDLDLFLPEKYLHPHASYVEYVHQLIVDIKADQTVHGFLVKQ